MLRSKIIFGLSAAIALSTGFYLLITPGLTSDLSQFLVGTVLILGGAMLASQPERKTNWPLVMGLMALGLFQVLRALDVISGNWLRPTIALLCIAFGAAIIAKLVYDNRSPSNPNKAHEADEE